MSLGLTLLGLLAIPALVALNGFFVAAEFALVAIRKTRVEELQQQGLRRARAVQIAHDHLDRTIAATQLGITMASIALGWVGEQTLASLLRPMFASWAFPWPGFSGHSVAVAVSFAGITFMHVIFGELMPKTIALQSPEATALLVSGPLNVFAKLSRPIIALMNGSATWLVRRLGYRPAGTEASVHSVQELKLLIEDTEEAGILDPEQADFVQNVFEMTEKTVRDCMVPFEKMAMLDLHATPEAILQAVREGAHTRMPVYEGSPENIVGIVNTKSLFYIFSLQGLVVLEDAVYPPIYLDPDETIDNALRLFRKSRRHMALVRDDKGKILGMLTLEDVLEEIVGDIEDEHDRPIPRGRRRKATANPKTAITTMPSSRGATSATTAGTGPDASPDHG